MTIPAQIAIQLEQPDYRPGETVRGKVHLIVNHDLRPRGVILHAFGEEVTTLGPNTLMTQHTHPFALSFNLWLPTAHNDRLPQGEYHFPIEFVLPNNLPPNFNGEFTRIVYLIEAKVDLPLQADIRHEVKLTVLPALLIDTDQPVWATGTLPSGAKLDLELNRRGFYPGERIASVVCYQGVTAIVSARVELISREKAEAREFADHIDKVRVRVEIDPAQLGAGQPFSLEIPIPDDAGPSFVGQHSAKERLVRASLTLADHQLLTAEAVVQMGVR